MLKAYIGTKIILAEPKPDKAGGDPGYRVVYPDGYESWSPKEVFEKAYRLVDIDEERLVKGGRPNT